MNSRYHTVPNRRDILNAAERVAPAVHRTPVMTCSRMNELTGRSCFFKMENFQRGGAFKIRGAYNAVSSLTEADASRGAATHSSGNHAQAVALAARERGIPAYIVMPSNAPSVKIAAVREYGGQITFCEPTLQAREEALQRILEETQAAFIHPYDDSRTIAGQATCALEFCSQVDDLDALITPVGGGGLLSGTLLTSEFLDRPLMVFGAEPARADDACRSVEAGRLEREPVPDTIADGLRTYLSELTFSIISGRVHGMIRIEEQEILSAMRLVWERMKAVIEPSGAVALAAALYHPLPDSVRRIGIIITGGNVDLDALPWMGDS